MAKPEWLGTALTTAQVVTLTFGGTWEVDDVVKITLYDEAGNSTLMSITSGSSTIATICTTVAAAVNAVFTAGMSTSPFYYVVAAAGSTTVTLTARTPGVPFYCLVATTEAGDGAADSQTLTSAVTIANSGINDFNTTTNWTTNAVPVDGDSAYITSAASNSILYGLYQNTALTLTNTIQLSLLKIEQGAPQIGTLAAPLCVQYDSLDVGASPADGSRKTSAPIWNLKPGAYAVTGIIRSTGTQGSGGRPPLQISVSHASAKLTIVGSSIVGVGTAIAGETVQASVITVRDKAQLTTGSGMTLATLNPEAGICNLAGGVTTINYGTGTVNMTGASNVTTATIGGKFVWESTGTLTTLNIAEKGQAFTRSGTITNATIFGARSKVTCDSGVALSCTFTNGVICSDGAMSTQVNYGSGVKVTPS